MLGLDLVVSAPRRGRTLAFPERGGAATTRRSGVVLEPGAVASSNLAPDGAANDDDARLVAAMAAGDRGALGALYDRHAAVLLAVAQRVLGDRREAEDLLHDVFLEAFRQAGAYDPSRASVRAWLLVRLRSRAVDRKRSVGASRVVPTAPEQLHRAVDTAALSSAEAADASDRARVRRALAELPDEQREVLELGYFEGLSSSEIAARIDVPIGTVKSRVADAIAKLRAGLGSPPEGAAR